MNTFLDIMAALGIGWTLTITTFTTAYLIETWRQERQHRRQHLPCGHPCTNSWKGEYKTSQDTTWTPITICTTCGHTFPKDN